MAKYQREKGKRGERYFVSEFKKADIPAKRISMNESNHEDKGDILIANTWKGSVKIGAQVPKFIKDSKGDCEFLLTKRDYEEPMVTMSLKFFLEHFI